MHGHGQCLNTDPGHGSNGPGQSNVMEIVFSIFSNCAEFIKYKNQHYIAPKCSKPCMSVY
jgi:hypothetical protein